MSKLPTCADANRRYALQKEARYEEVKKHAERLQAQIDDSIVECVSKVPGYIIAYENLFDEEWKKMRPNPSPEEREVVLRAIAAHYHEYGYACQFDHVSSTLAVVWHKQDFEKKYDIML